MAARRQLYGKINADLRYHPKVIATAKTLKIPSVYLLGNLTSLWLGALEFAEDGDLWQGDEESSLRFFDSLADIQGDPQLFLTTFQSHRWLDGWLIHDWLDHTKELLIARHSSHNRDFLVRTYKKYNRVYGRELEDMPDDSHPDGKPGKLLGSDREVRGKGSGSNGDNSDPPLALSPEPKALSPIALTQNKTKALSPLTPETKEIKSPMGCVGRTPPSTPATVPRADFSDSKRGSSAPGYPVSQAELTGNGLTHKEVFEAFFPLLVAHGILSLESFFERVKRSKVPPATWIMLYLDKIHAVYRDRQGGTLLDEDADPVGMTMAGLIPGKGRTRHQFTEAARSLFIEIMRDHHKAQKGERPKWPGKLSGPTIVVELERRKGKASKIA